jgi:hypothetical protein
MTKNKSTITANLSVGFCEWLALLFIALKLTGYIQWSWWWVLSPIWVPVVFLLGVFLLASVCITIGLWLDSKP